MFARRFLVGSFCNFFAAIGTAFARGKVVGIAVLVVVPNDRFGKPRNIRLAIKPTGILKAIDPVSFEQQKEG